MDPDRPKRPAVLVIGVGNPDRGDDAAGPLVVECLSGLGNAGLEVRYSNGDAGDLLEALEGRRSVILVDAVLTGSAPGTILRWEVGARPLEVEWQQASSHTFSLGQTIELARALGRLSAKTVLYGLEGRRWGLGRGPLPAVRAAVGELALRVRREALEIGRGGGGGAVVIGQEEGPCTKAP